MSTPEPYDYKNDPSLTLSNENVAKAREGVKNGEDRVYTIYTDGVFDLFHIGHMNVLKQAKFSLGDPSKVFLIAGVCNDADVLKYKGLTVMDGPTRVESVSHCKWVDKVVYDAPWTMTDEFMKEHKIDFIAHDAIPYVSAGSGDVYAHVKEQGKFLATERTEGVSTSDIIVQIVKDYDSYVERNLSRGFNKKQLNVGSTWEIRAVAHEKGKKLDASLDKMRSERKVVVEKIRQLFREIEKRNLTDSITTTIADSFNGCSRSRKSKEENKDDSENQESGSESDVDGYNSSNAAGVRLMDESVQIVKHSFRLCSAMCEIAGVALSYLNIMHYVDKCKQTRKYNQD